MQSSKSRVITIKVVRHGSLRGAACCSFKMFLINYLKLKVAS